MLKTIVLSYLAIVLFFYVFSYFVMFQPPRNTSLVESKESIHLCSSSGKKIAALYFDNPKAKYTILFSHGNAEDLVTLRPFLERLTQQGFSVLAYDYPGYTASEGFATEQSTYQAINAAYDYLTQKQNLSPDNIILYGRSLGTGPTVDLATRAPIAGVILESPFVSAYRAVTQIPLVVFDKFQNIKKVGNIKAPVLVLQGTKDEVIPFWQGKKIFWAIKSQKESYWIEDAHHNDIPDVAKEKYWDKLTQFSHSLEKKNGQ